MQELYVKNLSTLCGSAGCITTFSSNNLKESIFCMALSVSHTTVEEVAHSSL